ncbi:gamma-glutamyltransferase [Roseimicrobium gellanilyticum]|nr:gamma-glutamyltransferase [Roseimicrobium gellanilyticum]
MVSQAAAQYPGGSWEAATPESLGVDKAKLAQARDYALTGEGSGRIIYRGKVVMEWGDPKAMYDLKSSSKGIGVTLLGIAMKDGKANLDDLAKKHHPDFGVPPDENKQQGWPDKVTLRMLANQTAGFAKKGGYEPLLFEPGTKWHYSDGGPNWLAECLTLDYGRDLDAVMWERVFTPIGIKQGDIRWRTHAYRPKEFNGVPRREFGSGFTANVQAMARLGYLYLRDGKWNGQEILPKAFIDAIRHPEPGLAGLPQHEPELHELAPKHYSMLWWNNIDGTISDLPKDACWTWGMYDSLIVVVPSLDLVVVRAGKSLPREEGDAHYEPLKPFLGVIASAMAPARAALPYPRSTVITGVEWSPVESIVRSARGSDNWPMTWADDDAQYTAYGDGNGFEPFVPQKLSMGFAKITGGPGGFTGTNVRSSSGETIGHGPTGKKASGMLCVDGVLYLWARNAGNAQLAWSEDHGVTWQWSDWKFTTSFGCPTFLNFGKNYAGARDEFVYTYSQDADSAYNVADGVVLARVPKGKLKEQSAWEFFAGLHADGTARWSGEVKDRQHVLKHPGKAYRTSVSYHASTKRYLLVQPIASEEARDKSGRLDVRFSGGLAVFDAPEPWGPWSTVFYEPTWDTGPGDSASLPVKWMAEDGRALHLVFSGNDSFSIRKATLKMAEPKPVWAKGAVASVHPLATEAGLNAMKRGGNAVDAAIATAITLGVVDGHNSGLGGGCFVLIRRMDGLIIAIDGRETAPALATRDMYLRDGKVDDEASKTGALAPGTPGALAAYAFAIEHHGKLNLADVLLPAAKLAEEGFALDAVYARKLESTKEELAKFPASKALFFKEDGSLLKKGDVLKQPDLARTLRNIAEHGPDWFYRGEVAEKVDAWMKENGGILRKEDFGRYEAKLHVPLQTDYRGYEILGFPPPSSGGVHVAQILNMLETFELASMPVVDREHVIAESMKLAFADRAHWLGDPDFAKVPRGLIHRDYARELAAKIDLTKATVVPSHGEPPRAQEDIFGDTLKHTTHLSAADAEGNWVALTQTVNTAFGSKVIVPGTGVILNNEMDDFAVAPGVPNAFKLVGAEANAIAPGKRPLSSMSPTIVLDKDGEPFLAIGAAGGPTIISQTLQNLVNVLDLKMGVEEALGAPRLHHQWSPDELRVEKAMGDEVMKVLRERGHIIKESSGVGIGVSQGVMWDKEAKSFRAAHDPRVPGKADGW